MNKWTDWVLCKVTRVDGQVVTMLLIGEYNGTEFSFTIPPNLEPPEVDDQFRFTPLQNVGTTPPER